MGLNNLVRGRGFRNFMAKLYGIGAAVVILGALFKINHYTGANEMLYRDWETDRKSTRLNSSHSAKSRMPSSA